MLKANPRFVSISYSLIVTLAVPLEMKMLNPNKRGK